MEKDIVRIQKNPDTEIVVRVDDFGGRVGLTIREFVKSDRYTGFTKAGTRIPLERLVEFKDAVASIDVTELENEAAKIAESSGNSEGSQQKSGSDQNSSQEESYM